MKFTEANWNAVRGGYKRTKIQSLVESFVESGIACAKVEIEAGETYKDKVSPYNSILQYIKRNRCTNLSVKMVKGEIYILRTDMLKEEE